MKAVVYVTLKSGVLDPQGQAVSGTLGRLGFDEIADVRVGKYIELEIEPPSGDVTREATIDRVTQMCERLLANTVIEDYRIEIES